MTTWRNEQEMAAESRQSAEGRSETGGQGRGCTGCGCRESETFPAGTLWIAPRFPNAAPRRVKIPVGMKLKILPWG